MTEVLNLTEWWERVDAEADRYERAHDCQRCADGKLLNRTQPICHKCGTEWEAPEPEVFERTTYACDRCGDMGWVSQSGSWSADDDRPCTDCRAIGYESSPYGPDGDWGWPA